MATSENVQAAYIAYLKSQATLTSLLPTDEIRESEWQGTEFTYPNVRVSVDFFPAINGCQDRAEVFIEAFSEEKSSKEASHIASVINTLLHRLPFTINGVTFYSVIVQEVTKPERSILAWKSKVKVRTYIA